MTHRLLSLLRHQLDQAFDGRSWHGTNLMGSLRGLDIELVAWRPQPRRHNIAELAVHAAYWKYRAYRKLTQAPPRSFDLPGSDFFPRPGVPSPEAWEADLRLLREWHARLVRAVESFPSKRLGEAAGNRFSFAELIGGAAAHDLYHAGQIQLIKRMYADR